MGFVSKEEALAKGPVVRALDEMSADSNARQLMTAFRDAIIADVVYQGSDQRQPDFPNLSDIIKNYLFAHWSKMQDAQGRPDPAKMDSMTVYLQDNWFGPHPAEYAGFPTRAIYGMGLIKVLDSSLRGQPNPLPIDGYWFIHADRFELISLESSRQVTFLVSTPLPVGELYNATDPRAACEAWVTTHTNRPVRFEVSPPDLDPAQPPSPVQRNGDRICTYKIAGGPDQAR